MPKVELIYFSGCPNVNEAREQLLRAFTESGLQPHWVEWDSSSPDSPACVKDYGSPTILVNGCDVENSTLGEGGNCCRIYWEKTGQMRGVPAVETITSALLKAKDKISLNGLKDANLKTEQKYNLFKSMSVLPGLGIALLPKLTCPACWPAYSGVLISLGLGFVDYTPYLLPLTSLFLTLAVASLGYRATSRRGYKPLILGILATVVVMIGKFFFANDLAMYVGIGLLMVASFWNSWPKRKSDTGSCSLCAPTGPISSK